jgi:hypothetical protein
MGDAFNSLFDDAVIQECIKNDITPAMLAAGYSEVCRVGPHGPPYEEVAMRVFQAMLSCRLRGGEHPNR